MVRTGGNMDESTASGEPARAEGFPGQRLCVVPRPLVATALRAPVTRRLTVTDIGLFPHAAGHRRSRDHGAAETIVILCISGSGSVRIGDVRYPIGPSDAIVIPAGAEHEYGADTADPWTIWWMHVRGEDVAELTGPVLGARSPLHRLSAPDRVIVLFDEILTLLERRLSPGHLLSASGAAWQLLARIAADAALPVDDSPLDRAMQFLESRVEADISVSELAAIVGLSPSHLSALFRRATGSGPAAFHTTLKLARARALLDSSSRTIAQVAAAVGYTDPLYFSRQFRRVHGMSPSAYRALDKG